MGCSSTKNLSSIIGAPLEKHDPVSGPINTSSPHRETRSIENCIVIWLVASSTITTHKNIAEKLRQIISILKIFNNPTECITFIENIREEKVFLIVSPEMEQAVRSVHYLSQLEKIYIFSLSFQKIETIDDQIIQTRIFLDINELCEQIHQDVKFCELDLINIIVVPAEIQSTTFSAKQVAMFTCIQLVKKIALRIKFESEHKDVFLDFCRPYYVSNEEQIQYLEDFENNYRPKNVLWWITKPCFLSKILHRVLRTYEIDIIYKMGFIVRHIHTQLTLLHENIFSLFTDRSIVYRGKTMLNDEFDILIKNNCGGILSFSNFLTASIHKKDAMDFIQQRLITHPKMAAILFEICLDLTIRSTANVCAIINNLNSNMKSEEGEICFTMGTVFRIQSVEQVTDNSTNIWIVKLTFVDDNDQQFYRLVAPLRTNDVDTNPLSYLGKLLIEMGASERAEQFYLDLQTDPSVFNQPRRLARLQNGLGLIFTYKGDHMKALEHYHISLKTTLSYMSPDHPDLASIYKSIGDSYRNTHNYIQALANYEHSAQLLKDDQHSIIDLNDCIIKTKQLLELNKQQC
ncbi:unnamed protein product [Adineta steineri]|uniref:Uncharacterized protein n=1 Tax=Adineta steineri TaxID=433720 RepID=A0A814DCE2_9BILA|nr:unnamed protein product [Adineta steineri]